MSSSIAAITRDSNLARELTRRFASRVAISSGIPATMPDHVLMIDARQLTKGEWTALIAYSRRLDRPSLVLCEGDAADIGFIARLAADTYVYRLDGVADAVERHLPDRLFREGGRRLAQCVGAPKQLSRFIAVLFDTAPPFARVESAARAAGVPPRTLRYQLRQTVGANVTLHEFVTLVRRLRMHPPYTTHVQVIEDFAQRLYPSPDQDGRRTQVKATLSALAGFHQDVATHSDIVVDSVAQRVAS